MEFREVKTYCKHAAPATKCPATFKDCNADNCPLAQREFKRKCNHILATYSAKFEALFEDMESDLKAEFQLQL